LSTCASCGTFLLVHQEKGWKSVAVTCVLADVLCLLKHSKHLARMSEDLVIDLEKDVYEMMSDKKK